MGHTVIGMGQSKTMIVQRARVLAFLEQVHRDRLQATVLFVWYVAGKVPWPPVQYQ